MITKILAQLPTIGPRSMSGEYGSMIITFKGVRKNKHFVLCFFYLFIMFTLIHRTLIISTIRWDRRDRDRIVVGFLTTYAISAYHH